MTQTIEQLTARVRELELEVVRLREVMADVIKAHGYAGGTPIEVLSAPFTPTALTELIEQVEKMTIERCAVASWNHYMETCKKHGHGPDVENLRDFCSTAAIRKLGEQ